ncbi:unnamed protein product [Closterium sp. Naga37s-1]|nr:unnamed protein product [Closterium sp. Naga37s-1]
MPQTCVLSPIAAQPSDVATDANVSPPSSPLVASAGPGSPRESGDSAFPVIFDNAPIEAVEIGTRQREPGEAYPVLPLLAQPVRLHNETRSEVSWKLVVIAIDDPLVAARRMDVVSRKLLPMVRRWVRESGFASPPRPQRESSRQETKPSPASPSRDPLSSPDVACLWDEAAQKARTVITESHYTWKTRVGKVAEGGDVEEEGGQGDEGLEEEEQRSVRGRAETRHECADGEGEKEVGGGQEEEKGEEGEEVEEKVQEGGSSNNGTNAGGSATSAGGSSGAAGGTVGKKSFRYSIIIPSKFSKSADVAALASCHCPPCSERFYARTAAASHLAARTAPDGRSREQHRRQNTAAAGKTAVAAAAAQAVTAVTGGESRVGALTEEHPPLLPPEARAQQVLHRPSTVTSGTTTTSRADSSLPSPAKRSALPSPSPRHRAMPRSPLSPLSPPSPLSSTSSASTLSGFKPSFSGAVANPPSGRSVPRSFSNDNLAPLSTAQNHNRALSQARFVPPSPREPRSRNGRQRGGLERFSSSETLLVSGNDGESVGMVGVADGGAVTGWF